MLHNYKCYTNVLCLVGTTPTLQNQKDAYWRKGNASWRRMNASRRKMSI